MTLADGCSMLHLAALRLDAAAIRIAARAGDDPNGRDAIGHTPMSYALCSINAREVRFPKMWSAAVIALLDVGADLYVPRYTGCKYLREGLQSCLSDRINAFECQRALRATLAVPVSSDGRARL